VDINHPAWAIISSMVGMVVGLAIVEWLNIDFPYNLVVIGAMGTVMGCVSIVYLEARSKE